MTRLAAALLLCGLAPGCSPAPPPAPAPAPPPAEAPVGPTPGVPFFEDATAAAKIDFVQYDPATPKNFILETVGSGCGWIDYDADGWPDLLCVQIGPVAPEFAKGPPPTHKFYRNNRDGTFADVTAAVGLDQAGFGQGCAVGDYDNDGFDDLVVTYFGKMALYHNEPDPKAPGGRRFRDVTAAAGLTNPYWGTSCGWGDVDGDGKLDLYVCNYCRVDLDHYKTCTNPNAGGKLDICPPTVFPTAPHKLFRNNGNGTFADVSESSGVAAGSGYGFAVGLLDMDADGKLDAYVANDMKPAFIFRNEGNLKFSERGVLSGAGLMEGGRFMAGMGVAIGDVDGSGRPSVLVSNYQDEPTMVFLNRGKMRFQEWSHPSGVGPATRKTLGFGLDLFDADGDGNLDLAQANGHVIRDSDEFIKAPYRQAAQLFLGDGKAHFREVSGAAGGYFREKRVGRGLAVGDYDNDGRPDLVFTHVAGPAKLLRNRTENGNKWVRLDLVGNGTTSNRNAVGARVEVTAGGRTLVRWVHGGGSYLSAADRRVLVGLGSAGTIDRVAVVWPDGARQEFTDLAPNRGWRLTQGRERAEAAGG